MEATTGSGSSCFGSFGQEHFVAAELGDRRLTRRAVITADALLARPQGTLPAKLSKAQLLGFYDFANNLKVCHENLLAAHYQRTAQQARAVNGVESLLWIKGVQRVGVVPADRLWVNLMDRGGDCCSSPPARPWR
jgi:hypothetical protein